MILEQRRFHRYVASLQLTFSPRGSLQLPDFACRSWQPTASCVSLRWRDAALPSICVHRKAREHNAS